MCGLDNLFTSFWRGRVGEMSKLRYSRGSFEATELSAGDNDADVLAHDHEVVISSSTAACGGQRTPLGSPEARRWEELGCVEFSLFCCISRPILLSYELEPMLSVRVSTVGARFRNVRPETGVHQEDRERVLRELHVAI